MNDQGYKFNTLTEYFPQKAKELAESKNLSIGELRKLIWEGVYYIDDSCELVENSVVKAWADFNESIKGLLPAVQEAERNPLAALKRNSSKNRELIGAAGEDLEFGDCVIFGEDGKIYKAKS